MGAAAPVGPQFYQWTITVSVHGYLFQEVRDWISNWKEVVFVRKRLFFSILSPVNDHSSKKEKDGTFRFGDFRDILQLLCRMYVNSNHILIATLCF